MIKRTLNLSGRLYDLSQPLVMGIVNVTPDSFYPESRVQGETALRQRLETIVAEGGDLVDLGAYSSRPGADEVSAEEEMLRLAPALKILRDEYPELPVSVDTFRSSVARWAVEEYGVSMINDISGGTLDEAMARTIAELQVPYVLMHMRGTPQTMQSMTQYDDVATAVADFLIERVGQLYELGVHDLIIDPGFGFGKTLEQNYELLSQLPQLKSTLGLPLLVGLSRKSMIYRLLEISSQEALNGTSVLHTLCLERGADILRVHDVLEARQCVRLVEQLRRSSKHNASEHLSLSRATSLTSNNG